MPPETAEAQPHTYREKRTSRRVATAPRGGAPALAFILVVGLAGAVALSAVGATGLGWFSQEVAIVGLTVGLATVSLVLFFFLVMLRATNREVERMIIRHEAAHARPQPAPRQQPEIEVFPRAADNDHIIRLRGMDDTSATLLNRAGVFTIADMRAADPRTLEARTDLPKERLADWRNEADLMRVPGIGPAEADLLAQHGVQSAEELAHSDPRQLRHRLNTRGPVRQVQVQRRPIDDDLLTHWIENARTEVHDPMSIETRRALR